MTTNALKVRTTSGKPFHRCGLVFGAEWTVVPAEKLAEKFGSPVTLDNSPMIGEILEGDGMLICLPAEKPKPEKTAGDNDGKNGGGKGK